MKLRIIGTLKILAGTFLVIFIVYIFAGPRTEPSERNSLLMPIATQITEPGFFNEIKGDHFEIEILDEYVFSVSSHIQEIANQHTTFYGVQKRKWYEFAPVSEAKLPLIILLHGAGRDGLSMLQMWEETARHHRIALLAPN